MQAKQRNILIVIFVIAVIGVAAVSFLSRHNSDVVGNLYGTAMANLAETSSMDVRLVMDTFIKPPPAFGEGGGLLGSIDVPIKVSGPISVAYPKSGQASASTDLKIASTLGNITLLTLRGLLTGQGNLYAQFNDLPQELGADIDIEQLNGTWFSVDSAAMEQLLPWIEVSEAGAANTAGSLKADELRAAVSGIFIPYRRYDDTTTNGRPSAHYEMALDSERLVELLAWLTGAMRAGDVSLEEKASIAGHVSARRWLAEAWVDTELEQVLEIKLGIFPYDGEDGMPVAMTLTFEQFDQPLLIAAPENASPLSVVLFKALRIPAASFGN